MIYTKAGVEFDYDPVNKKLQRVLVNNQDIVPLITGYLQESTIIIRDVFNSAEKEVKLHPNINQICMQVFHAVQDIRKVEKDEWLAALLASRLFESFTVYWKELLANGRDIIGVKLWKMALAITKQWEDSNSVRIHKGTPFFFLAQNYFLTGDRDLAFIYLNNALVENKRLGEHVPSSGYPFTSPSYYTATMRAEKGNHMYPLIEELRQKLDQSITRFQNDFNTRFSLDEFDLKFLNDKALTDTVTFFVYNWQFIVELEKNTKTHYLDNDFSRLRILDAIFNLCLIIDEVLKAVDYRLNGWLATPHSIRHGILALNRKYNWISQSDLESFWGDKGLNVKDAEPDQIVPILLDMKLTRNGKPIPREIFTVLLAYNLRNYAGHNIKQQHVLSKEYDRIISQLLMSLFLSVRALN